MSDIEKIQLFEDQKVRTIWVESDEKWYFSIKDVILILAEAKDPKDYLSKMRRREPELAKGWGQIVHPLVVRTPGGPQKENFANLEGMFRIIQSFHSSSFGSVSIILISITSNSRQLRQRQALTVLS